MLPSYRENGMSDEILGIRDTCAHWLSVQIINFLVKERRKETTTTRGFLTVAWLIAVRRFSNVGCD